MDLADAARDRAEDDLGGAPADVDDADLTLDRMAESLRRADEGKPALLVLAEDLDREPGGGADRLGDLLAVRCLAVAAVATIRIASAPSSCASRTWVATTSATSAILAFAIEPSFFRAALPIRV